MVARVLRAGNWVPGNRVRHAARRRSRRRGFACREQELVYFAAIVGTGVEESQRCSRRVELRNHLEPHSVIQGQLARDLPGVLHEPLVLVVTRVVDLLHIVLAVRLNAAEQQIRNRIAGVEGIAGIGSKIVSALRVVDRVHAHVAGLVLQIESHLDLVAAFDPSEVGGVVGLKISPIERPAVVEAIRGGGVGSRNVDTLRLGLVGREQDIRN